MDVDGVTNRGIIQPAQQTGNGKPTIPTPALSDGSGDASGPERVDIDLSDAAAATRAAEAAKAAHGKALPSLAAAANVKAGERAKAAVCTTLPTVHRAGKVDANRLLVTHDNPEERLEVRESLPSFFDCLKTAGIAAVREHGNRDYLSTAGENSTKL